MRLKLIEGTPPPDTPKQRIVDKLKRQPRPATMLQCPRCASREVLTLTAGALLQNGKLKGGATQVVCATCFMKGERVVLA